MLSVSLKLCHDKAFTPSSIHSIDTQKLTFFGFFSALWRIRRKLSFDTKNTKIELQITKSKGGGVITTPPPLPVRVTIFDLPVGGLRTNSVVAIPSLECRVEEGGFGTRKNGYFC